MKLRKARLLAQGHTARHGSNLLKDQGIPGATSCCTPGLGKRLFFQDSEAPPPPFLRVEEGSDILTWASRKQKGQVASMTHIVYNGP